MASDSFTDAIHKLKEIHDKEVLGMQAKLTELTMEKCRDSQRIEELFSKNHLLREQQKVLNENIKVLENRLRAGLCDRCTVTQELAKKKQQEFENSLFHSLQQISILTSEMNSLKEENRSLLEELKKLRCLDERSRHPRAFTPETNQSPESPHHLLSSPSQKNGIEKTNKDAEAHENLPDRPMSEDKSIAVCRLSPVGKSSQPGGNETRSHDMHMLGVQKLFLTTQKQQRISNQLHGTIAVLKPGSRSGQTGTGTSSTPNKRTANNEILSKGNCADSNDASSQLDLIKHAIPEEQMCLLRQYMSQRRLEQRGSGGSGDGIGHCLLTKSREAEMVRKRPQDDWEERAAMAELHGAVLYLREHGYKGRVSQLDHRERLHYILSRQHQGQRSPKSPGEAPKSQQRENLEEGELSLFQVLSAHWKNKHHENQTEDQEWEENKPKCAEQVNKEHVEELTPDKPLDLSDTRRGQHCQQSNSKREQREMFETCSPSPTFTNNSSPLTRASSAELVPEIGSEDIRSPRNNLLRDHQKHDRTCSKEEDIQDSVMVSSENYICIYIASYLDDRKFSNATNEFSSS
ncbi:RBBP8 N-terminal-like protein [Rhinophrynus dorsalis]